MKDAIEMRFKHLQERNAELQENIQKIAKRMAEEGEENPEINAKLDRLREEAMSIQEEHIDILRESMYVSFRYIGGKDNKYPIVIEKERQLMRLIENNDNSFNLIVEDTSKDPVKIRFSFLFRVLNERVIIDELLDHTGLKVTLTENPEENLSASMFANDKFTFIAKNYCLVSYVENLYSQRHLAYKLFEINFPETLEGIKSRQGGRVIVQGKEFSVNITATGYNADILNIIAESNFGDKVILDCKILFDSKNEHLFMYVYKDYLNQRIWFIKDFIKENYENRLIQEHAMKVLIMVLEGCNSKLFVPSPELKQCAVSVMDEIEDPSVQ